MDLKEARKRARYSQEAVAEHIGCSRPTYAKFEQNPELVTIEDAKKLSALFGVKISDIFFDQNYS